MSNELQNLSNKMIVESYEMTCKSISMLNELLTSNLVIKDIALLLLDDNNKELLNHVSFAWQDCASNDKLILNIELIYSFIVSCFFNDYRVSINLQYEPQLIEWKLGADLNHKPSLFKVDTESSPMSAENFLKFCKIYIHQRKNK